MKNDDPLKTYEDKDMTFSFYVCIISFGLALAIGTVALVYFLVDNLT